MTKIVKSDLVFPIIFALVTKRISSALDTGVAPNPIAIEEPSTQKAISFYRNYVKGELHPTNARTAEMCKLVENSSRDVQIAFANELSLICDKADINVWDLIKLANKHPRVNILQPGSGVGGHCIAVDPYFIISDYPQESKIIGKARDIDVTPEDESS